MHMAWAVLTKTAHNGRDINLAGANTNLNRSIQIVLINTPPQPSLDGSPQVILPLQRITAGNPATAVEGGKHKKRLPA
jgi:hypothetical protein